MPIAWASRHPSGSQAVGISIAAEMVRPSYEAKNVTGVRVPLIMRESDISPVELTSMDFIRHSDDELPPARRYERKPSPVKESPNYKSKREKNNEAVRRCRAKAKKVQNEVEDRVKILQRENQQLRLSLEQKDEEIARLKEVIGLATGLCNRKHTHGDNGSII